ACGGGGSSGSAGSGEPPPLPVVGADNIVSWPVSAIDSTQSIELTKFAQLPLNSVGAPKRMNVMATVAGKIFVGTEQSGVIYEVSKNLATAWFDVAAAILATTGRQLDTTANWHAGLRSLAFHPNFATNGRFYTTVMEERPADPSQHHYVSDSATPIAADGVLIEWQANPQTLIPDPASYRDVLRVGMPVYDHTIKQIIFGPDGLLYLGHGDGSVKSASTGGGQNNDALGKILRINPLASGGLTYTVPADNPFVNNPAMLDEVFSLGHRNPHHLAFASDGTLIVAEPGRDNVDEINIVSSGSNYGWPAREGTYVHLSSGGLLSGLETLPTDDANTNYVYPAIQYGHVGRPGDGFIGQALGGGYVVENGSALNGLYFFCEFATIGDIYFSSLTDLQNSVRQGAPDSLRQATTNRALIRFDNDDNPATPPQAWDSMVALVAASPIYDGSGRADIRFGQGPDGTLYLMSKRNSTIYRVENSRP
ncbi:MAG: PQQ-dependent sugar dehydrogenase, partial [Burkholderiaceae bacterium]